jgi:hypothetical protein
MGLSDEQKRWAQEVSFLQAKEILVPGDSINAAALLVYGGPFTSVYREQLQT